MEDKTRMQCRLWWPRHLSSESPHHTMLLLGWVIHGFHNSVDIVVAASVSLDNEGGSAPTGTHLQAVVESTQTQMSFILQGRANLLVVGCCIVEEGYEKSRSNTDRNHIIVPNNRENGLTDSYPHKNHSECGEKDLHNRSWLHEKYQKCGTVWIELICQSVPRKELRWIPELFYFYWEGLICAPDIHTVIYEQPRYGSHHFSFKSWRFLSEPPKVSLRDSKRSPSIPQWMVDLEQQREPSNLDVVMSAMNSASAVQIIVQESLKPLGTSCKRLSLISIMINYIWIMIAASVAFVATLFYISLQFTAMILRNGPLLFLNKIFLKLFRNTWINLHVRSRQLIYWPVILVGSGFRFQPTVAVAHRTALLRHSIWSAIAFDIFLGSIGGLILITHCEAICNWVLYLVHDITDDILRSGCAWLMGVPAGFKLNTKLAETLGIFSLTSIQVWSTLWFFVKPLLKYGIKVLAVSGFFLGFTIQAALFVDIFLLATLHISTLHWLLALVYSHQIQALAALLRLFRGQKRNPLRARIDSYDYSVEQHVVGSLVFTPLLLLLPTTSVFYIFFTILNTVVSLVCIGFQFLISILHAFPYAEIVIWLIHPKRFPSGIWFKQIWTKSSSGIRFSGPKKVDVHSGTLLASVGTVEDSSAHLINAKSPTGFQPFNSLSYVSQNVISVLGTNIASLGEVISPHLGKTFKGLSLSSGVSCAYKVFSGGRVPSSLNFGVAPLLPWMSISFKEFWWLTYEAVLSCL